MYFIVRSKFGARTERTFPRRLHVVDPENITPFRLAEIKIKRERERGVERWPFPHCPVKHARCCVTFANGLLTWDVASSHLKQV